MPKQVALLVTVIGLAILFSWLSCCAQEATSEIVIGTTVSLEGQHKRPSSEQLNGLRQWVEETNTNGGLLGRKIKLIFYDDQSDPKRAAELTARLINDDAVNILVSPYSSPSTLLASEVSEKHGVPMLVVGASASEIWTRGYRNVVGLYTPAGHYMDSVIEFAADQGVKSVAMIYEDSVYAHDLADGVRKKMSESNMRIVFEKSYPKGQSDFGTIVEQIYTKAPDMLIGGSYLDDAVAVVEEIRQRQTVPGLVAFAVGPGLPDFGQRLKDKAEGIMGNSQWEMSLPYVGISNFSQAYQEKYGYKPGYHAAGGYSAGQVIGQAYRRARVTDNNTIRNELFALDTDTVFGRFRVDATGAQIGKPALTIQWFGKRRVIVLPERYASRRPLYPLEN